MKEYVNADYLLQNETAKKLYHEYKTEHDKDAFGATIAMYFQRKYMRTDRLKT